MKSGDYELHNVKIRPQVIDTPEEISEHDVVFDEIEEKVIQGIRDVKIIHVNAVEIYVST